jgi:phosphoribosyl 1,2-cyclic phosphodiesterase
MIGYCPLASGSKGNCTYFGTQITKILVDAGLTASATNKKLQEIGVRLEEIDAILISHEHSDHIEGLKTILPHYPIPILANAETAKAVCSFLGYCPKCKIFTTEESFTFGDIRVHPFSIQHDTVDPVAFVLHDGTHTVGICTDLGYPTSLVRAHLKRCDFLIIESNHEPAMVHASARPMVYKKRVLGRSGHLSNAECATLLADLVQGGTAFKHIHLAHLSQECNSAATALATVTQKIGAAIDITIAPQDKIGKPIYFLSYP